MSVYITTVVCNMKKNKNKSLVLKCTNNVLGVYLLCQLYNMKQNKKGKQRF